MFEIKGITEEIKTDVRKLCQKYWGSPVVISRGNIWHADELPGFVGVDANNEIIGLITYHIKHDECEIVTIASLVENRGLGSRLIETVVEIAKKQHCKRVWLITTNDNLKALRFYQKRGFDLCGLHLNALNESRKLKPEIPLKGMDGIPLLHEIELEIRLTS